MGFTAVRDVLAARSRARSPRERNGRQTALARGYLAHEAALLDKCRPINIRPVPTINLTDDELAAVTAAIQRAIEGDRFPHAPRLDPLRAALGKFNAAAEPAPLPKAAPPAKVDKRTRR